MQNYNENILKNLKQIVELDEYDDLYQNEDIYQNSVSGEDLLVEFFIRNSNKSGPTLDIGCGSGTIFKLFDSINYAIEPNNKRFEKTISDVNNNWRVILQGWGENTGFEHIKFSTVLCWGAFCFVRSPMEVLIEVNRILGKDGVFIFDVNSKSNLAIVQTVDPESFINWVSLFGFTLIEQRKFEDGHRVALAFKKVKDFDYKDLLMPQCIGTINNYNPKRDWYLR